MDDGAVRWAYQVGLLNRGIEMARRDIDPVDGHQARDEDWEGNNAAFTCPVCGKVFIVSAMQNVHNGQRTCPNPACGHSVGHVTGGRKNGGTAYIEW
jgi:predicted RNA-binding Zn-ribbon protein involved in translation (DUF1610 family)